MNEKQFWDFFLSKGLTEAGTAGLLGNLSHESGLRFNNLENSYERKFGLNDDQYTIACDAGKHDFVHDSAGYGLAQWTYYSRKQGLWDLCQQRNVSIADPQTQLDFLMMELPHYASVWKTLTTTNDVRAASDIVLTQFERPADQSQAAKDRRYQTSKGYYDRLSGSVPKKRSYSPLCDEIVAFGGKNSNQRLNEVTKITIHHMAGVMKAADCARMHLRSSGSSANYYVGNDGKICGGVSEDRRAWTSGTGNAKGTNDHRAITIEVSNSVADDPWPVSEKAYKSTIRLCADICKRYGIKPHYDGTKNGSLTLHSMFQATACPGPYLRKLHENGTIERDILAAMGEEPVPKTLWRVQTGAFANKDNAFGELNGLRAKGQDGIVVLKDGLYKVQVGAFENTGNAERKKAELESLGYATLVTDKGGEVVMEGSRTYTVQPGDTLSKIAREHNTSVANLIVANGIQNPDVINVGQRLVIA